MIALHYILLGTGVLLFLFFLWIFILSLTEQEGRAAVVSLAGGVILGIPVLFVAIFVNNIFVLFGVTGVWMGGLLLFFISPHFKTGITDETPGGRIDERDIMFSRRLLYPGTQRFKQYYDRHPENKVVDDRFRKKPGLLDSHAVYYDPVTFAAADAFFDTVEELSSGIEGPAAPDKKEISVEAITGYLKDWVREMGAVSSGVAVMQPYHYYHTGGRDYNYGDPVQPGHRYGFVFTVEMDREMMNAGPLGPSVMESAYQYLEAGKIAVVLAKFIRRLGYDARAHIDGHYQVVCPLVARDAGLGEIGRMGLLMTPRMGPRVRIGVVTTSMKLQPDHRNKDEAVIDFCHRCKKCAVNCPVHAIPDGDPEEINGVRRWQINQEVCYTYWTTVGTDCGRCVAVCPFSHPDNLFHRLVRWGIHHSLLINKLALPLDGWFYGKKPSPGRIPKWLVRYYNKKVPDQY